MSSPIYITIAADDCYARHMGIVALSLLSNTTHPERLHFFFLDAGIGPQNRDKLQQITDRFCASHEFIQPNVSAYEDIDTGRYGTAALFRLSLGSLLPDFVERVIYLDCDVVAFDDVAALWEVDIEQYTVAAVTNLGHQPLERLNIADGEYFNSGILLIDLRRWREQHIGEEVLSYMVQHNDNIIFPDQDGLNRVLQGRWKHLPLRWNLQPATYSMYRKGVTERTLSRNSYVEAINNPGLVHFLGKSKPWNFMSFHPLKDNYWAYVARSPWSSTSRLENNSLINRLKKALQFDRAFKRLLRRMSIPLEVRRKGF